MGFVSSILTNGRGMGVGECASFGAAGRFNVMLTGACSCRRVTSFVSRVSGGGGGGGDHAGGGGVPVGFGVEGGSEWGGSDVGGFGCKGVPDSGGKEDGEEGVARVAWLGEAGR